MPRNLQELVERLDSEPGSIHFSELRRVCEHYFGGSRNRGSSHLIFKTGLRQPALVNIQPQGKMAKAYQCRQVAAAIRALEQEKKR